MLICINNETHKKGSSHHHQQITLQHNNNTKTKLNPHLFTGFSNNFLNIVTYTIYGFVGFVVLIAIVVGFIQSYAWDVTIFLGCILLYGLYTCDFYSDIMFSIQLYNHSFNNDGKTTNIFWFFIASLVFLLFPVLGSIASYLRTQSNWESDASIGDRVRGWLRDWSTYLLFLTLLSGSSFAAINMVNCRLFGHPLFCMGLSHRHLKKFENQRLYSVIILENLPQLILQISYTITTKSITSTTIWAMIFGLLSIIWSIIDIIQSRRLFGNTTDFHTIFRIPCESDEILTKSKRLQLATHRFRDVFAGILRVHPYAIEVDLPSQTINGLVVNISVSQSDKHPRKIYAALDNTNLSGHLSKAIEQAWKLDDNVHVGIITMKEIGKRINELNTSEEENHNDYDSEELDKFEDYNFQMTAVNRLHSTSPSVTNTPGLPSRTPSVDIVPSVSTPTAGGNGNGDGNGNGNVGVGKRFSKRISGMFGFATNNGGGGHGAVNENGARANRLASASDVGRGGSLDVGANLGNIVPNPLSGQKIPFNDDRSSIQIEDSNNSDDDTNNNGGQVASGVPGIAVAKPLTKASVRLADKNNKLTNKNRKLNQELEKTKRMLEIAHQQYEQQYEQQQQQQQQQPQSQASHRQTVPVNNVNYYPPVTQVTQVVHYNNNVNPGYGQSEYYSSQAQPQINRYYTVQYSAQPVQRVPQVIPVRQESVQSFQQNVQDPRFRAESHML